PRGRRPVTCHPVVAQPTHAPRRVHVEPWRRTMSEHGGDREGTNRPPSPAVRREIELAAAPADVWNALTRPELLEQWFEAEVELDPRPGGAGRLTGTDGERRSARVDDVDARRRRPFSWWSDSQVGEPATQ